MKGAFCLNRSAHKSRASAVVDVLSKVRYCPGHRGMTHGLVGGNLLMISLLLVLPEAP
ncbi:hypothetical protein GGTG_05989 [Gaeumannomyces tritici R3-111a-1]|uniref:Uncharacterized protein n=1 Tax=Gaeumannomyces tritici (strain R3-111a-1) TaxID=644352 RepID=J3NXI3_GAET3|nr:hypothetical protein GGTG_05989 [Gaeumannomyces tritici R3-111a-1]EJT76065.1 hypothetical protein GGTG_05989 [Gaeumannomyces tritici R3-111a-1]